MVYSIKLIHCIDGYETVALNQEVTLAKKTQVNVI